MQTWGSLTPKQVSSTLAHLTRKAVTAAATCAAAAKSYVLVDGCDKKIGQPECEHWRALLADILAGNSTQSLEGNALYCNKEEFNAGLGAKQIQKAWSSSFSEDFGGLDITVKVDVSNSEDAAYIDWVSKKLESACDCAQNNFEKCWNAAQSVRQLLSKHGLKFPDEGYPSLNNTDCSGFPVESTPALCVAGNELHSRMRGMMLGFCSNNNEFHKEDLADANLEFLSAEAAKVVYLKIEKDDYSFRLPSDSGVDAREELCGWDKTCWRQYNAISDTYSAEIERARQQMGPGCYVIESFDYTQNPPKITWKPAPNGCKQP